MQNDKPLVDLVGEMHILEPGAWDFDHYRGDGPYDSFVERKVRQRIESRGWEWKCGYGADIHGTMRHYASVMGEPTRSGPTPAAALLTAYIAALEALNP